MMERKPGRSINRPLSDRERILMTIIDHLSGTFILMRGGVHNHGPEAYQTGTSGTLVHFANYAEPKPGDLVLAKTGHVSEWKIGWYVEKRTGDWGGAVIREIGSDRLCNYENESFVPIVGLDPIALLEGDQRAFYVKVVKAFAQGGQYSYRFGGVRFDGDDAVVTIREVFGGMGNPSQPFDVRMKWGKRTSVKAILSAMRDGGYGTRSFRPTTLMLEGTDNPSLKRDGQMNKE